MNRPIDPRPASVPKLPLWDAIRLSYAIYGYYFRDLLRMSWLWLVVAAPLTAAANWLQWSSMAALAANARRGMSPQMLAQSPKPVATILFGYLTLLVLLLAGVGIAVAWHRRIILDEHPGMSGSNVAGRNLWGYAGVALAILLVGSLPLLAITVPVLVWASAAAGAGPVRLGPGITLLTFPVNALVIAAGIAIPLRLSPMLAARAVGDTSVTFKRAWRHSRRNTWRLYWGLVACTAAPMLAVLIVFLVSFGYPDPLMFNSAAYAARMTVAGTILTLCYLLILPIGIGFLSISYRFFFERR